MKKSIFSKVGAAAMVLTLVTASLVGGTFAKYVTDLEGTASGTVAKWGVNFTQKENVDFTKVIALEGTGANGTILPGDSGSFDVLINGAGADVGYKYKITVTEKNADGIDLTFTGDLGTDIEVPYSQTAGDMNKTAKISWSLPNGINDAADTDMAGKTAEYIISMHAEQLTPKSVE